MDLVVDENDSSNDEEIQLTSAEVIEMMEEAWLNEKFAPEILPHKLEVVECLLGQISSMEDNIQTLDPSDFKRSLHQLELDRIRFLISSYLRNRLEKIETYIYHIIKQEEERLEKHEALYLTQAELIFARTYKQNLEDHFTKILDFHTDLTLDEWKRDVVKPNVHSFVFLTSKKHINGVVIDNGEAANSDLVDLNPGSRMIISYKSVSSLIKQGDVHLI